MNVIWMCFL